MTVTEPMLAPPPSTPPRTGSVQAVSDVRFAAGLVVGLLVLGAALGPLWAWWSPPGPAAIIYPDGALSPAESEAWIGGDGRFLTITAAVGLLAGLGAWFLRRRNRGAVTVAALAVGGVGGALVMDLVGYLTSGGDGSGKYRVQLTDGSVERYSKELPLWVHTTGVLVVEAGVAVLVYGLLVAFTARDDLGRPDPVRDRVRPPVRPASVDAGRDVQHGRADGDAPGPLQQG